jgi:hypothetical protein
MCHTKLSAINVEADRKCPLDRHLDRQEAEKESKVSVNWVKWSTVAIRTHVSSLRRKGDVGGLKIVVYICSL